MKFFRALFIKYQVCCHERSRMKAKQISLACLITGIIIAVTAMNLLPAEEKAPEQENNTTRANTPSPQASVRKNMSEDAELVPLEIADIEETSLDRLSAQYCELLNKVLSGKASEDEQLAFWNKMRTSPEIDTIIDEQERQTPKDSGDIQGHMNLAKLYCAKLLSASSGLEKGLWAEKAEKRWQAVLEIDPNHWSAQHSVAFSLSQYPDFLNKTGEAIDEYEKLVAIQRELPPEPRHAQTYLELYRLYQKVGDPATALEVLEEGLELFPENKLLIDHRSSLSTLY